MVDFYLLLCSVKTCVNWAHLMGHSSTWKSTPCIVNIIFCVAEVTMPEAKAMGGAYIVAFINSNCFNCFASCFCKAHFFSPLDLVSHFFVLGGMLVQYVTDLWLI